MPAISSSTSTGRRHPKSPDWLVLESDHTNLQSAIQFHPYLESYGKWSTASTILSSPIRLWWCHIARHARQRLCSPHSCSLCFCIIRGRSFHKIALLLERRLFQSMDRCVLSLFIPHWRARLYGHSFHVKSHSRFSHCFPSFVGPSPSIEHHQPHPDFD